MEPKLSINRLSLICRQALPITQSGFIGVEYCCMHSYVCWMFQMVLVMFCELSAAEVLSCGVLNRTPSHVWQVTLTYVPVKDGIVHPYKYIN